MDDHSRYQIIATAASIVSRLNPGLHDDIIGKVVADTAMVVIAQGQELDTASLASLADDQIETMTIAAEVMGIFSRHLGRDDFDLETRFDMDALGPERLASLTRDIAEVIDVEPEDLDISQAESIGDIVMQICTVDDQEESCPCGNPHCGGSRRAQESQDREIANVGVTLAPVLPGHDSPGFVYSVGLSEKGKFDLLFVGDCAPATFGYLAMFIDMQMNDIPLTTGLFPADHEFNRLGVPIWLSPADEKLDTHATNAVSRLERIGSDMPPRLVQVVMPDKSGRFPWEPGYDWIDQEASKPIGTGVA